MPQRDASIGTSVKYCLVLSKSIYIFEILLLKHFCFWILFELTVRSFQETGVTVHDKVDKLLLHNLDIYLDWFTVQDKVVLIAIWIQEQEVSRHNLDTSPT